MFTYRKFIDELRPLVEEGKKLFGLNALHEDPSFRKWRHEVTDLIERIEQLGYSVNCDINTRAFDEFGSYTHTPSRQERTKAFNRDLQDTINELITIVDRFGKYDDPKTEQRINSTTAKLEWPDKITLAWLFHHAPVGLWLKFAGMLMAAFLIGMSFGQSSFYSEIIDKFTSGYIDSRKAGSGLES